jgi:hypothetical protein
LWTRLVGRRRLLLLPLRELALEHADASLDLRAVRRIGQGREVVAQRLHRLLVAPQAIEALRDVVEQAGARAELVRLAEARERRLVVARDEGLARRLEGEPRGLVEPRAGGALALGLALRLGRSSSLLLTLFLWRRWALVLSGRDAVEAGHREQHREHRHEGRRHEAHRHPTDREQSEGSRHPHLQRARA